MAEPQPHSPPASDALPAAAGVELGVLAAPSGGGLRARFGGAAPVPVRAVVGLEAAALVEGAPVLAVRVAGEAAPVVIGVVARPGLDGLAQAVDFGAGAPTVEAESALEAGPLEVEADGRRVVVEARDELVLRCGEASLTLRADGKVTVRGTHIVSHSTGPHRLKGGSVSIN